MHVSYRSKNAEPPRLDELSANSDRESAIGVLSRVLGIEENVVDIHGGSRSEFDATIRHALFFCIQAQDEIASQENLFHSQGSERRPQAIRDVLPYFLGVVDPHHLVKRERLRTRERELRMIERQLADEHSLSLTPGRATALLAEAAAVGLASSSGDMTRAEAIQALSRMVDSNSETQLSADRNDQLVELFEAREQLRSEFSATKADLRRFRKMLRFEDDFNGEAGERRSRLQTLNLLNLNPNTEAETAACPLCSSTLSDPITSVSELREQLARVSQEIEDVDQDRPRLQQAITAAERRVADLTGALSVNQEAIDQTSESAELLESMYDISLQRAAVRGRISLFLSSVAVESEDTFKSGRIAELRREISSLISDLDEEAVAERLASALSRIAYHLTETARKLELEHAPAPARIDVKALTVIVDTYRGSYRLREIGSAANWLGYHLATLIALHTYFCEHQRPVPRFLILDQPSQVYFPPDSTAERPSDDADHQALIRVFNSMFRLTEDAASGFQIIVFEHADLDETRFQEAIVERWREDDAALIPQSWIDLADTDPDS